MSSVDGLHDLQQMAVGVLDPGDAQAIEPWFGLLDGRRAELDKPLIARRNVVGPEDHRRALASGDWVETMVLARTCVCREAESVPVEDEINVDRCSDSWRTERFFEAESAVERHRPFDIAREQNDLGSPEGAHTLSLHQSEACCN